MAGASDDLAAPGLEGGIKEERAVTQILEPVTLGPSRRERQHRVEPVEGALFVHAEDGGMGRRGQIPAQRPALRVPAIYVDNDAALLAGRELGGYPKKMAQITMRNYGNLFLSHMSAAQFRRRPKIPTSAISPRPASPRAVLVLSKAKGKGYLIRVAPPCRCRHNGDPHTNMPEWVRGVLRKGSPHRD